MCSFAVGGGSIRMVSPNVGGLRSGNDKIVIASGASDSFLFALKTSKTSIRSEKECAPSPPQLDPHRAGVTVYLGRYRLCCVQTDTDARIDRKGVSRKPIWHL